MRKLFTIAVVCFLLAGCASPIDSAKRMVFQGATKPIGELLESHPQVKKVDWQEMPVLGEGVVIAKITFVAEAAEISGWNAAKVEKERQAIISIKVVKNSGMINSIESTSWFKNGKNVPCVDVDYFLKELEQKGNLAYAFWGMPPEKMVVLLQNGELGTDPGM